MHLLKFMLQVGDRHFQADNLIAVVRRVHDVAFDSPFQVKTRFGRTQCQTSQGQNFRNRRARSCLLVRLQQRDIPGLSWEITEVGF